jgi:hypothetical protein
MNEIECPNCHYKIKVDEAFNKQIESEIVERDNKKHESEIISLRNNFEKKSNEQLESRLAIIREETETKLKIEKEKQESSLKLEREKMEAEFESKKKTEFQNSELQLKRLQGDMEDERQSNKKLHEQLSQLMEELRSAKKAKDNAELEAKRKLSEEEDGIREEAKKNADEEHRLKQLEMEKKLADTQKALSDAQRKAEQGSQQNQGEVLELDLENSLRMEFPTDRVMEVKKGMRGADVTQTVINNQLKECGILLWESKNAAWQASWVPKFKEDIRNANANIGVLVSKELPANYGDMHYVDNGVWAVKPKLALAIAAAMRSQIIGIYTANHNNENKDIKMETLYQFLTGPEFRHRIEAIVENYTALQDDLEQERRLTERRWAKQEKMIHGVIDNTIGMYGELQGITGGAIAEIKQLKSSVTNISDD